MYARLCKLLPRVFFQRIETSTGLGVPDLSYTYGDVQGWIELKEVNRDVKNIVTIPWRKGQLAWYHRYRMYSECPYVLVLTIQDSWYFITMIQEKYRMGYLDNLCCGTTKELKSNLDSVRFALGI